MLEDLGDVYGLSRGIVVVVKLACLAFPISQYRATPVRRPYVFACPNCLYSMLARQLENS